jgi:hypothetical protein
MQKPRNRDVELTITFEGNTENVTNFFAGIVNIDYVWLASKGKVCPTQKDEGKPVIKRRRKRRKKHEILADKLKLGL